MITFFYKIFIIICSMLINIINLIKIKKQNKNNSKINNVHDNYFVFEKKPNGYKNINSSSLQLY